MILEFDLILSEILFRGIWVRNGDCGEGDQVQRSVDSPRSLAFLVVVISDQYGGILDTSGLFFRWEIFIPLLDAVSVPPTPRGMNSAHLVRTRTRFI